LLRSFSWIYIRLGKQQTGAAVAGNIQKSYTTYFCKEYIVSHGSTLVQILEELRKTKLNFLNVFQ